MIDKVVVEHDLRGAKLCGLADQLESILTRGLDPKRYGDIERWQLILDSLPTLKPSKIDLAKPTVQIGTKADATTEAAFKLQESLQALHPWRKGPFDFFGLHIDTEWRSDWKWERLEKHISPLENAVVLDVGCGSGYHLWRMLGHGARLALGIDPQALFLAQFAAVKQYTGKQPAHILPMGIESLPENLEAFDTVFSMGVLYHRRSPLDHLRELFQALRSGGELVLETLIVPGEEHHALVPQDRYAQMRNVWFLPTTKTLEGWLARMGFVDIRTVDINVTTTQEQRSTPWMRFHSLADFLDPDDPRKTVEGYPAPMRGLVIARRP